MASNKQRQRHFCQVCLETPWHSLEPEDQAPHPHHQSPAALEASARTCSLCRLLLKSARSHSQHLHGVRDGKGFWTLGEKRQVITRLGETPKDFILMSIYGSCMPSSNPVFSDKDDDSSLMIIGAPAAGTVDRQTSMIGRFAGATILAPTGITDSTGEHVHESAPPSLKTLAVQDAEDMRLWVYGNWLAKEKPKSPGEPSQIYLMGVNARFGKSQHLFDALNTGNNRAFLCGSTIGLCTNDNQVFPWIQGRLRELNSASDRAFERLQNWATDCSSLHKYCKAPPLNPPLPTRVLDVLSTDRGVALLKTNGQRGRYVALSHSWGSSPRLTANSETIEDLEDGIANSFLPKTFQEAIQITRRLGVRYLWIDCLCIQQDDDQDWLREASAMGTIYQNSYLTISAACSKDSSSGCLPVRNEESYVSPATISLGYENPRTPTGDSACVMDFQLQRSSSSQPISASLHFFEEWLPGCTLHSPQRMEIGAFGKRFDPIAKTHLSTRGWTLQERLLSRRTIHYAHDQMYFECDSGIHSEDGFMFLQTNFQYNQLIHTQLINFIEHGVHDNTISLIVARSPGVHQAAEREKGGWLSLVCDYSQRKLTRQDDKLTTLAGLARLVAQETGDKYFAGLWGSHMYEDLCWRAYPQDTVVAQAGWSEDELHRDRVVKRTMLGQMSKPSAYRAPSWSWAAIDGPIKFTILSYSNLVAKITDCTVVPSGDDAYGKISGGELEIEAPLFEVFPFNPSTPLERPGTPVYIDLKDDRGKSIGTVHMDLGPYATLSYPCYAMFLDPSNAIIVRSTGRVSKRIREVMSPESLTTLDDSGKIMDTPVLRQQLAANPALGKSRSAKPMFDVERIGLADFVRAQGALNKDGVGVRDVVSEREPAGTISDRKFDPSKVAIATGKDSWGPVTKDDPRLWLTIV